ncbi:YhbD family protein [Ethanoligenens sp.]|uniref:YhbD family protein n=1 Tax=Ethanoligenens sp. TaxID=2099655 RepID=UPI0039EC9660
MDNDMISKKDLLALTGISYGQLYRWKRVGLIPEDWFIRKATYTGQETFFPREKVLARLEKILQLKDGASLQALADVFSPSPDNTSLTIEQACAKCAVSPAVFEVFASYLDVPMERDTPLGFDTLLFVRLLEQLLKEVDVDEGRALYTLFRTQYKAFQNKPCELIVLRKLGVCIGLFVRTPFEAVFEEDARVVVRIDVTAECEALKLLLL